MCCFDDPSPSQLEDSDERGTHWTAYYKNKNKKYYFDSYGDAFPPEELVRYLGYEKIKYNEDRYQNYSDPPICGHLCLLVLKHLSRGEGYDNVLRKIEGVKENFFK